MITFLTESNVIIALLSAPSSPPLSGCPCCFQLFKFVIIQFHCLATYSYLSIIRGSFNIFSTSMYNISDFCLIILFISPIIMQLVCITHFFFCLSNSFPLRLGCSRDVPFIGVDFKDTNTVNVHFLKQSHSHCSLDPPSISFSHLTAYSE